MNLALKCVVVIFYNAESTSALSTGWPKRGSSLSIHTDRAGSMLYKKASQTFFKKLIIDEIYIVLRMDYEFITIY